MRDAHYLRTQAELCLEIAGRLSDPTAAESLRSQAAQYHAEAAEVEANEAPGANGGRANNRN